MKKILITLVLCLLLCGCNDSYGHFDINKLMKENEYLIVDVRTVEEYQNSHVINSINVPYDEIKIDSFDKDKIIFVYCKSGRRSKIAYDYLKKSGYEVYDLGAFDNIDLPKK